MMLNKIISEVIDRFLVHEGNESAIIGYIKQFGIKGKLPSCSSSLVGYYKPYLEQAYDWASSKLSDIKREGFASFVRSFRVDIIGNFKLNKRGLIYVERSLDIDGLDGLGYSSVGECWSWKPQNAQSYCSNFGVMSQKNRVVICGYVHPDSIDWLETIYLNSYDMKNETEIRMNDNAQVEVAYIKINGVKYSIGGSMLINASSDKYAKKDW